MTGSSSVFSWYWILTSPVVPEVVGSAGDVPDHWSGIFIATFVTQSKLAGSSERISGIEAAERLA